MPNTIEYAKLFQKELDKQILEGATSGWMEENASQVIYNGGAEIKMPKMSMQGLGTYSRDDGYVSGAVTYSFETFALSQDRGRRFRIDAVDVDESGFGLAAANVASEFQRTKVIPEIDAYRYSKLAAAAGIRSEYTPDKSTVLSELLGQLSQVRDVTGGEGEAVIIMSRPVYDKLMLSSELSYSIDTATFTQGSVDFTVKTMNGVPVIPVPSARMKTDYIFSADGDGGFLPASNAKDINWLICPKSAPVAVSKTDNVKIITPEANQFADAWDVDYRKYHDLFVPDNKKSAIAVCVTP
ncbi:MAG: hypothetical protein ACI4KA_08210 [Oscillospiraceae bacterium]